MTIDDDKFQEFVRFYASYTESSEEWAEKVRRFRASKLYAKMAGEECFDVEQPDIENLTYEDGSKYATTNAIAEHRALERLKSKQRREILPGLYLLIIAEIVLCYLSL